MTQLNTPYPSTAYLTGFLRSRGVDAVQEDLALALVLKLFSAEGLTAIRDCIEAIPKRKRSPIVKRFRRAVRPLSRDDHADDRVPAGARPDAGAPHRGRQLPARRAALRAARRLSRRRRRRPAGLGLRRARHRRTARDHLARLYLDDLADVLRDAVDPRFEFVRYGERWRRASRPSIRSPRRWPRRSTWSTARCAI